MDFVVVKIGENHNHGDGKPIQPSMPEDQSNVGVDVYDASGNLVVASMSLATLRRFSSCAADILPFDVASTEAKTKNLRVDIPLLGAKAPTIQASRFVLDWMIKHQHVPGKAFLTGPICDGPLINKVNCITVAHALGLRPQPVELIDSVKLDIQIHVVNGVELGNRNYRLRKQQLSKKQIKNLDFVIYADENLAALFEENYHSPPKKTANGTTGTGR